MTSTARTRVGPGIWKRTGADGRDRYEITYRDSDGRQRRQVVEGGKRAAETALSDVKARMGKGERVAPSPRLTFAEASEKWMKSAESSLRPATVNAYRSVLETHLLPAWGKRRLDRIDVDVVASLVERMKTIAYRQEVERRLAEKFERRSVRQVEAGYRGWTISGVLVPAGRIFDYAHRRLGWAGTNPVRELDRRERPAHERKERRILTRDELLKVIAAADEPYRTIIATAAGLGTRLGETLGLRWRDIDLEQGTASIRGQIDRSGKLVELKTARSRRVVEIPGSVVSALRELKVRSAHSAPADLVFTSRGGGPMEHRNVAQRGLGKAYERTRLDGPSPTFHELRHAHASAWIAAGGDLVELSARLGHRDPAITAAIYSHEFEAQARSGERRTRLDTMYGVDDGSAVAASGVNKPQQGIDELSPVVADLQAIREERQ